MNCRQYVGSGANSVVVCTCLLLACLLSIGEELAGEERAGEETEVIERDGKRLILVNPRGQVSYLRREVGENELTASRGQVEDELRRDVLAVFLEGERLEKVRAILNRPWDEAGIGYLWGLVEHVVPERRRSAERVGLVQRSNILRLLAHVSTKYGDSKEATLIRSKFDSLLLKLADPEAKPRWSIRQFAISSVPPWSTR